MTRFGMMVASAVVALALAGTAHAGQKILATAPALAAYPQQQTIYCDIVSLNSTPVNVTVDVMDYFGNVVQTGTTQLLPNNGTAVGDGTGNGTWCRFTVDGSPKKYRGVAIYDNNTFYTVSNPAQ